MWSQRRKGPGHPRLLFQLSLILILKEFIFCGPRKTRQALQCPATIYWTSTVKNSMINHLYIIFKIFTYALQGRYYPQLTNRETKCLSWLSKLFKVTQLMRKLAPVLLLSHLLDQLDPSKAKRSFTLFCSLLRIFKNTKSSFAWIWPLKLTTF